MDIAKKFTDKIIKIKGTAQASDTIALHSRKNLTTLNSITTAAQKANKMAGISSKELNFAEVHDCFTIAEVVVYEDLGFCEKFCGRPATEEGRTVIDGKTIINKSGGLKSKGHPVGATGVAQIIELYEQLTGKAGKRQVKNGL
jgi:acetyl-CoA C-acetyltransferase